MLCFTWKTMHCYHQWHAYIKYHSWIMQTTSKHCIKSIFPCKHESFIIINHFWEFFITTFSLTSNNISTNLPFLLLVVTVTRQPRNLWRHDSNALCGETPHAILIFYCVYDKSYGIVPPWTTPEKVASYLCSMVDVVTGFWLYRSAIYTITQLIFILQ